MNHITQKNIADALNVSRITVSKALRNHPDISTKMKKQVMDAVKEMGYTPNLIATQLTTRKTLTLGIVVPDLENSFFSYAIDSIIDAATARNYHVILTVSRENEKNERKNIENLIGMRVDGLLVCVSQTTSDPEIFEYIRKFNTPLVFFDRVLEGLGFSTVVFNDRQGTMDAMDEVIRAGYKKIAHFAGYTSLSIGRERCEGYKMALNKNGLEVNKEWIIEAGFEVEDGYQSFKKLYATGNLPEIILAVNDRVALGAYKAIRKLGLDIPGDIGIIGYGFSETAQLFSPSLSIINQDPRKMGLIAVNTLIDEILDESNLNKSSVVIEEDFQWKTSVLNNPKAV
jgi:LacI family transcriptional regulator